ncbi:hypothetical protein [Arachidicoccus soli]|nr:hypothetical protein [Arachidicoccus soli]
MSIAQIVLSLKQQSTGPLWKLHGSTIRKQYWYQHFFWVGWLLCLFNR